MNQALSRIGGAIDGRRTAAEVGLALSPEVPAAISLRLLGQLEGWGLIREGALEDRSPVAWAVGCDGRFLAALLALLDGRLEAIIEVPAPPDCPVHLHASFAARQPTTLTEAADSIESDTAPSDTAPSGKEVFGGRGFSPLQSVVSCLAEGAESLASRYRGDEAVARALYADVATTALHPEALLHFSPSQYAGRAAWNRSHGGHNWIPPRFDENRPVGWLETRDLCGGPERLIPAAYCYQGYRDEPDAPQFCVANSNGCASAPSLDEAVVRGFCELAERDAAAIWWYCHARRPGIDLDTVPWDEVRALRHWLAGQGRRVRLLDLTTDLAVPVVAAVSSDAEGKQVVFGFGANLDPAAAILAALTEMQQIAASAAMIAQHYARTKDPGTDPSALALMKWVHSADLASVQYLTPADQAETHYESWCQGFGEVAPSGLDRVREICGHGGIACYFVDLTREDMGIPTARVVAPELRHFWARFGPGRLYDVPYRLNWAAKRPRETALNPVAMFL